MLRHLIFILYCLIITTTVMAQRECLTRSPKKFIVKDSAGIAQRWQQYRTTATYPLIVRIYIVVFADNDGSDQSVSDDTILMRIGNMSDYYAPHSICFIVGGIRHVNSTDLNDQNLDTEEDELDPYMRAGYITIFVHKSLYDADGKHWGGWAYNIPNTYLSVTGSNVADVQDIIAHEMGHCFGLYHTFETAHGVENVNRTGSCRDCDTDGDLICDTPADRDTDATFINANTCEYTGSIRDECGVPYQMATTNIMTYGRRSCRDHFTSAQGGRARDFIIDPLGNLIDVIAPDFLNVTNVISYSSGHIAAVARVAVSFQSVFFVTDGSAQLYSSAGQIDVKPGTTFSPGSGGFAGLVPNTYCH